LKKGPLVVSFYRGTWCPYCSAELAALVSATAEIRALGADLVVITPQSADDARPDLSEHPVPFSVLVDNNADVADAYGLAYTMPSYLSDVFKDEFSNDLSTVNAAGTWRLPIPGRFVIGTNGKIVDAQVNADFRYRTDPETTISVLESMLWKD
jgi:peroxiredoxin